MTVHVGEHEYVGNGSTRQEARHSAALQALAALKDTLMVKQETKNTQQSDDGTYD